MNKPYFCRTFFLTDWCHKRLKNKIDLFYGIFGTCNDEVGIIKGSRGDCMKYQHWFRNYIYTVIYVYFDSMLATILLWHHSKLQDSVSWELSICDTPLSFFISYSTILLNDCNWTRTQNHLVLKRTLNHLAKLAIIKCLCTLAASLLSLENHFVTSKHLSQNII